MKKGEKEENNLTPPPPPEMKAAAFLLMSMLTQARLMAIEREVREGEGGVII